MKTETVRSKTPIQTTLAGCFQRPGGAFMATYEENLSLDYDPFAIDAATPHFYPRAGRQESLDQLIEFCCYGSEPVAVTGDFGMGKSSLAQWLALSLDEEFVVAQVSATLFMDVPQFLEAITEALNLAQPDDNSPIGYIEQLDNYAESLRSRNRTLQLIIDNAHELGGESFLALSELIRRQADASNLGEDGIKVVLLGESALLNGLEQLRIAQPVVLELQALNETETQEYVEFKLDGAGFRGTFPLDVEIMSLIHERAEGNPGMVNTLLREELGEIGPQSKRLPTMNIIEQHLVAASVIFGALLVALFFTFGGNSTGPGEAIASIDSTRENSVNIEFDQPAIPAGALASQAGLEVASPLLDPAASAPDRIEVPLDLNLVTTTVPASQETETPAPVRDEGIVTEVDTPTQVPVPTQESTDSGEPEVESVVTASIDEVTVRDSVDAPASLDVGLLARAPDSYTLQLLGSHSESNVRDFIAANALGDSVAYFESRFQERPWYVVVYGNFSTRSAAREAIDALPNTIRDLEPWARTLSDIQADIRKYQ